MDKRSRQIEFNLQTIEEQVHESADARLELIRTSVTGDSARPIFYQGVVREEGEKSVTEQVFADRVSDDTFIDRELDSADRAKGITARISKIRGMKNRASGYFLRAEGEVKQLESLLSKLNDRGESYNPDLLTNEMLVDTKERDGDLLSILKRAAESFDNFINTEQSSELKEATITEYLSGLNLLAGEKLTSDDKDTLTVFSILAVNNAENRLEFWGEKYDKFKDIETKHLKATSSKDRYDEVGKKLSKEQADRRYIADFVE